MFLLTSLAALFALAPVQVTPGDFSDAREPQVAIDNDHEAYIAFGNGDSIYVSRSIDEGATYDSPIKVAGPGKLSLGARRGPRITARNGVLTVTATYGSQGGGHDGDLLSFRSGDRGKTWTGPARVSDVPGAAREGLHAMAVAPDGTVACTWLDLRSEGTKLFFSASSDGGSSWSKNRLVYASPSGSICQCCQPSVAFGPNGKLFVMFRNLVDGYRDMYFASSSDLGRTFAPAVKLGIGSWKLDACPMDGGSFDVTETGKIEALWRREGTLYLSGPTGSERMLAEGRQGWIARGYDGRYVVWSDGARLLARTPNEKGAELSSSANDGVVSSSPDGELVIAAWTERGVRAAVLRHPK